MIEALKPHFNAESLKVYFASATTSAITWNWSAILAAVPVVLTSVYIAIKIFKQCRDWNKPDKD